MSRKIYAGIGARNTPKNILHLMKIFGILLASKGYILNTGGAKGADQAFAEGATLAEGKVNIVLPWPKYETDWINYLVANNNPISKNNINVSVFNKNIDVTAVKSVYKLHPNPNKLKDSVIALHARNYLVLVHADFAICYTAGGKIEGGTGQAIRIMMDMGKEVFNLGKKQDMLNLCEMLKI